jgi:hypothetical protein
MKLVEEQQARRLALVKEEERIRQDVIRLLKDSSTGGFHAPPGAQLPRASSGASVASEHLFRGGAGLVGAGASSGSDPLAGSSSPASVGRAALYAPAAASSSSSSPFAPAAESSPVGAVSARVRDSVGSPVALSPAAGWRGDDAGSETASVAGSSVGGAAAGHAGELRLVHRSAPAAGASPTRSSGASMHADAGAEMEGREAVVAGAPPAAEALAVTGDLLEALRQRSMGLALPSTPGMHAKRVGGGGGGGGGGSDGDTL